MSAIQHFLLVFDHRSATLLCERDFGTDSKSALAAYADTEKLYESDDMIEIVLIGSDSIETVKLTHANYYSGVTAVSKDLVGIS